MKRFWLGLTLFATFLVIAGVLLYGQARPDLGPSVSVTGGNTPATVSTSSTDITAALQPRAVTPVLSTPSSTPALLVVNTPTVATVTIQVTGGTPIAGGVNLLRIFPNGQQPVVLGVMHDDGLNADAVAGDGVYTLQVSFNESAAGQIQLQVSAAFQGMLKRVFSPLGSLMTWNRYSDSVISLIYPPGWNTSSQGKTLSLISPDRATIQASGDENDAPANFTVTLLSKPVPFDIQSFVASYNAGWFLNYPNVTSLILNGKVANVYSDTGDTANYAPVIAAFIVGDSSIALVTLNDPENDQTPTDTSVFSQVLASIAF